MPNKAMPQRGNPKRKPNINIGWIFMIIMMVILGLYFFGDNNSARSVKWSDFQTLMEDNAFESITVYSSKGKVDATLRQGKEGRLVDLGIIPAEQVKQTRPRLLGATQVTSEMPGATAFNDIYQRIKSSDKPISTEISYVNQNISIWTILLQTLPFLLLIVFWIWMMRGFSGMGGRGGVMNVGKSKAQLFDPETKVKTTFDNVAGLYGAKQEVMEVVHFLKEPKRYTHLGGKIPKGVLLVGPPGTGKTLLAKAVAGEAGVPFFSLSGSDFVEMFVGVGASRVRDLFSTAKEKSPCIIFIDEIDAIGRARGKNAGFGGNDERENTLNQLLTEMDGFDTNSGVIVMAATNRADILDKALMRAGRFDRQIYIDLPDLNERKEIFLVHMKGLKLAPDVDPDKMARQTPGFSGADIANVCNEAALIAARESKNAVEAVDFSNAVDRVVGGLEKKSAIITKSEKKMICIHEAGHATISWRLRYANPLVKVTIVPRGRALGAAWYMPEERQIVPKEAIEDEMCATLGGRAAEELFIGHISTGASNDLEKVTRMAQAMVVNYGMSDKIPNVNYQDNQGEYNFTKPYSDETARLIDQEIRSIIAEQYERAKKILQENEEGHHEMADLLFQREVIYTEDVEKILGKRPWDSRAEELLRDAEEQGAEVKEKTPHETETPDHPSDEPKGTPSEGRSTPPPPPFSSKTEEEDSCSEQVHDSGILGADSCGD